MRIEILLIIIAGFFMANIYTEGKYMKMLFSYKKYYQMAAVAFGALMLYILLKRNPARAQEIMATTNDYVKYLPIDGATSSMLSPILDFTSKHNFIPNQISSLDGGSRSSFNYPVLAMPDNNQMASEAKIMNSGKKSNKRSVSETKKKFVASRQNWKCGDCQDQLNAWFEVDHKIRLEYGGSNHIDNLVALCRDCHGKKTTIENL
jgi:5-methylcytosine-specific restriction endonuclease McrA